MHQLSPPAWFANGVITYAQGFSPFERQLPRKSLAGCHRPALAPLSYGLPPSFTGRQWAGRAGSIAGLEVKKMQVFAANARDG